MDRKKSTLRLFTRNPERTLKDLLPIIEKYPDAPLAGGELLFRVDNPVDPIPEPVNDELSRAHTYVRAASDVGIDVENEELIAADAEFRRRREANFEAGSKHNRWHFSEQERLQKLLDRGDS